MAQAVRNQVQQQRSYPAPSQQANGSSNQGRSPSLGLRIPRDLATTTGSTLSGRTSQQPPQLAAPKAETRDGTTTRQRIDRQMDAARQHNAARTPHARSTVAVAPRNTVSSSSIAAIESLESMISQNQPLPACFKLFSSLDPKIQSRIYLMLISEYCQTPPKDLTQTGIDLFLANPKHLTLPAKAFGGSSILETIKREIGVGQTQPASPERPRPRPQETPQTERREAQTPAIERLESKRKPSADAGSRKDTREDTRQDARVAAARRGPAPVRSARHHPASASARVRTSHTNSALRKPTTKEFLAFYRGEAPNLDGVTIKDILSWKDDQLENDRRYFDWLFPLYTKSKLNPQAPLLNEEIVKALKDDGLNGPMSLNLESVLDVMQKFWGLKYHYEMSMAAPVCELVPGHQYHWLKVDAGHNHNFDRITQFLSFLKLIGHQVLARIYFAGLTKLAQTNEGRVIPQETLKIWREAAG